MPTPEIARDGEGATAGKPPHTTIVFGGQGGTPTTGQQLPGRAPGLHLTGEGAVQAKTAAARVAQMVSSGLPAVAHLVSSPLERTRETAAPLAAMLGLTVVTEPDLLDLDVGDWTGLALKEAAKRPEWRTIQRAPSAFRFPGGESFTEMQARLIALMDRWGAEFRGRTVVAVSHADPIRVATAHVLGMHLDLFQRIAIAPASVTAFTYGDGSPQVLTVNAYDPPAETSTGDGG
jgi:probable phosphomutase (TIGR03848 family)